MPFDNKSRLTSSEPNLEKKAIVSSSSDSSKKESATEHGIKSLGLTKEQYNDKNRQVIDKDKIEVQKIQRQLEARRGKSNPEFSPSTTQEWDIITHEHASTDSHDSQFSDSEYEIIDKPIQQKTE